MAMDEKMRDEKLQYDIIRRAAKLSVLSSGKIHKYECLTGEEILPADQNRVIKQVTFTNSPLEKALEKKKKLMP